MKIDYALLKNVMFLGVKEKGKFVPKATGFIVSIEAEPHGKFLYLVTAEHVISALAAKGHEEILVRFHDTEPSPIPIRVWEFHPDAEKGRKDVAVVAMHGNYYKGWTSVDVSLLVHPNDMEELKFGIGDEVVVVGLFRNHYGRVKNIPVTRVGSLSAMPEEPVYTRHGWLDAYIAELHSIGGLSGSPVYIHRPPVSIEGEALKYHPGNRVYLLGLVSGHFDLPNLREDSVVEDAEDYGSINSGMAVVVPANSILETINKPEFVRQREMTLKEVKQKAATMDVADIPAKEPDKAQNPNHKEDFTALLDAAARKQK